MLFLYECTKSSGYWKELNILSGELLMCVRSTCIITSTAVLLLSYNPESLNLDAVLPVCRWSRVILGEKAVFLQDLLLLNLPTSSEFYTAPTLTHFYYFHLELKCRSYVDE